MIALSMSNATSFFGYHNDKSICIIPNTNPIKLGIIIKRFIIAKPYSNQNIALNVFVIISGLWIDEEFFVVITVYIDDNGAPKNTTRFMLTVIPMMRIFSSWLNGIKDIVVRTKIQVAIIDNKIISCDVNELRLCWIILLSLVKIISFCRSSPNRLESSILSSNPEFSFDNKIEVAASYFSWYCNLAAPTLSHTDKTTPGAFADNTNISDVRNENATHPMQFPIFYIY